MLNMKARKTKIELYCRSRHLNMISDFEREEQDYDLTLDPAVSFVCLMLGGPRN